VNSIIVSDEKSEIIEALKKYGFNIISSECLDELLPFERKHSDIQCLRIDDTFFAAKNCEKLKSILLNKGLNVIETEKTIKKEYPENVILNAAYIKNKLYCKESSLDNTVKEYCNKNSIEIINVHQGYTKCSTACINDIFITADKGIFNAMTKNGVEGLLINNGSIVLPGCDYGFIGGCCFELNNTVYFTGDIKTHPDGERIKDFLEKRNYKAVYLTENELYDIGGFIII
jgi:hypothetical protein